MSNTPQPSITNRQPITVYDPRPTPHRTRRRAHWFLHRFHEPGPPTPPLGEAGNALAELPGPELPGLTPGTSNPEPRTSPVILISAHLDTVFPPPPSTEPVEVETRIL